MIDIENEVFDRIYRKLKSKYSKIDVANEFALIIPSFPFVSVEEIESYAVTYTQDSASNEKHTFLAYEVNVYTEKPKGKKAQAKDILAIVDTEFNSMGFTRQSVNNIQDNNKPSRYRIVARYTAIVDENNTIYGG